MFPNFCKALNASHLLENPNYSNNNGRALHREELNREINEITSQIPKATLVEKLNEVGCPCGPINSIDQAFADPQVQHLEISKPVDHPNFGRIGLVRMPINMPDIPNALEIREPAPELGENSDEVLEELGYSKEEVAGFREAGVI